MTRTELYAGLVLRVPNYEQLYNIENDTMIINYLSNNNNIVHKITNFDYVELHNGQHHYIITHLVTMYLRMLLYYSGERNALPHFFISRYTVVITNSLTNMSMPYHIKLFIRS